jgi:hypothetical protein
MPADLVHRRIGASEPALGVFDALALHPTRLSHFSTNFPQLPHREVLKT